MKSISGLIVCTLLGGVCALFLPQQHHHHAGQHSPHQYYDPDIRMPCTFAPKPKTKAVKSEISPVTAAEPPPPAPAPSPMGRMRPTGMAGPYVDPDMVADHIDTMRDMAVVGFGNPHAVRGYAAYPLERLAATAAMPAVPPAVPAVMPAPPPAPAAALIAPVSANASPVAAAQVAAPPAAPAAPPAAAPAKRMFRTQSQTVKRPTMDFFSSLFDLSGLGVVKRHATQWMPHAGNQAYRCMCVPSSDIDGTIHAAARSGRPNPRHEERINLHGKCPMGRTCLCPNLGHGWR